MSRKTTNQKSTSKYRKKSLAPVIPVIAIIEVLVLIAASTYAWYYLAANKTVETDVITVAPDSGLDIDFKNANTNDSINIWEYIHDDFKFEPATSLDGRNIYFPTSGTFGSVDTSQMTFRDATINDINSKYINIDFELTNTNTSTDMQVFLNNSSYFNVVDKDQNVTTSRALRLAFYPNDGSAGAVGSEMVNNDSNSDSDDSGNSTDNLFTVYFDNTDSKWSNVYAYFYDSHADPTPQTDQYPTDTKNYWVAVPNEYTSWEEKVSMTRISGQTYSYSFSNPVVKKATALSDQPVYQKDEKGNYVYATDENGDIIYDDDEPRKVVAKFEDGTTQFEISSYVTERKYDTVIFTNGSGLETVKLKLSDNDNQTKIYHYEAEVTTDYSPALMEDYATRKIYFAKPNWWGDVYAYTWHRTVVNNENNDVAYSSWPGDKMKYLGAGIYSYEYNAAYANDNGNMILFNDGQSASDTDDEKDYTRTQDTDMLDGRIYYVNNQENEENNHIDKYITDTYSYTVTAGGQSTTVNQYENMPSRKIYFYNSYSSDGWTTPYVTVYAPSVTLDSRQTFYRLPMTSLTGNVYYCTIPRIYTQAFFHQKDDFNNKRTKLLGLESTSKPWEEDTTQILDGYVYRPVAKQYDVPNPSGEGKYNDQYYPVTSFEYANHIGTDETGYAVISPGSSAGFQRTYTPVVDIDHNTGAVKEILPAFANSIDKYINNNEKMLFTLKPNSMMSLSMIIWLEGTDLECDASKYASNLIKLRLEFSTQLVNQGETDVYTYNFYDKTNGFWTSNRITLETGQKVAPVMQLYDETLKRGYLMKAADDGYTTYNNTKKIAVWTVKAPRSIADYGHEISFRRVNPYDEDEVWNYWDAGPCGIGTHQGTIEKGPIYKQAFKTTANGSVISFTAFGNGSPTSEMLTASGAQVIDVPERSCGGLWGDQNVHLVYALDGLQQQSTNTMHLKNYNGTLCIKYTYYYNYVEGGVNKSEPVTIEYMGSDSNNSVYTFPVPQDIYDKYIHYENGNAVQTVTTCSFKNYKGYNGSYALNSPKNNALSLYTSDIYTNTFSSTTEDFSGDFFEIGEKVASSTDDSATTEPYNYWGSDILYFQTNVPTGTGVDAWNTASSMYTDFGSNHLLRVHFFSETERNAADSADIGKEENDANDFFTVLYFNNNFQGGDSRAQGYACVIPNDKQYYFYRVERGNNACTETYNATKQIQLDYVTRESVYANSNITTTHYNYAHVVTTSSGKMSQSICKMDYFFHTVYLQVSNTYAYYSEGKIPQCQVWMKDTQDFYSTYNDAKANMTYVGTFHNSDSTELQMYKFEIPAKYNTMQFRSGTKPNNNNYVWSANFENLTGAWFVSGLIYENSGSTSSSFGLTGIDVRACNENENVYANFHAADDWPHFNISKITGAATVVY